MDSKAALERQHMELQASHNAQETRVTELQALVAELQRAQETAGLQGSQGGGMARAVNGREAVASDG